MVQILSFYLYESLKQFGFALQSKDFEKAANILGNCEKTPQTQSNFKKLAKTALSAQNLSVAQHCYSNLGDISKAAYLRKILKIVQKQKEGINHYKVQEKLAILQRQFDRAQSIFLSNNQTEQAMQMYLQLHKWDKAIRVAIVKNHPQVQNLKADYYNWLLKTKQKQKAAQVNQQQGKYQQAVNLYLKGGLPVRAATVVISSGVELNQSLIQKIATAIQQSGMYQKAGQFYKEIGKLQKALDCYCKGEAFKKALDLARRINQDQLLPCNKDGETIQFQSNKHKMQLIIIVKMEQLKRLFRLLSILGNGTKQSNCCSIKFPRYLVRFINKLLSIMFLFVNMILLKSII